MMPFKLSHYLVITIYILHIPVTKVGYAKGRQSADATQMLQLSSSVTRLQLK